MGAAPGVTFPSRHCSFPPQASSPSPSVGPCLHGEEAMSGTRLSVSVCIAVRWVILLPPACPGQKSELVSTHKHATKHRFILLPVVAARPPRDAFVGLWLISGVVSGWLGCEWFFDLMKIRLNLWSSPSLSSQKPGLRKTWTDARSPEPTHQTTSLTLLFLITSSVTSAILGSLSLAIRNPQIVWTSGVHGALRVALAAYALLVPLHRRSHSLLPQLPTSQLFQRFTMTSGRSSPNNRRISLLPQLYDCAVDLSPGTPIPSDRLYNLFRPAREAIE